MHQVYVLSPFPIAVVIDVVTELSREGVLSEWLYAVDLVQMNETIERLRNKFFKWKETFESNGMKVSLGKTKVMVVVVVVDPTPPTCCQQSPAPEIMWQPAVSPPRWQGKAPLCRDSSRGPG